MLAICGLILALPAHAQDTDSHEITVTGRGLEDRASVSSPIATVIETEPDHRLTESASGRLEDILRFIPDLAQFRRSDSRSAHPTSQGLTLRGLGGNAASRTLVLLDGVPQADPFGGWVAFPAYMPQRLNQIRVTRGGGSAWFGPGAVTGAIELESGNPDQLGELQAGADYGSRDSLNAYALGGAYLGERGYATIAGQYARGDGFVPVAPEDRGPVDRAAPYEQASIALTALVGMGRPTLEAHVSAFTDRRDRGVDFTDNRNSGADASVRLFDEGGLHWSVLAYLQTRAFSSGFASVNDARTIVTPTLDQYSVPSTGIGGRFEIQPLDGKQVTLKLGADARRVSGESLELFTYVAGLPTRRREAGGNSATLGGFAQLAYDDGAFRITADGRVDRWTITDGRLIERPLAGGAAITNSIFPDRSGWEPTGSLAAAYKFDWNLKLRASAYRGWRLPTLNELYRPFRVGADATAANAALDPERLWGAEAGIEFRPMSHVLLRAGGYWNRLNGAIANVTIANGPGTFPGVGFVSASGVYRQRRNLDAVESKGVELDAQYTRGEIELFLAYAYTDAKVQGAVLGGLRPAQSAKHGASATLGWHRDGWGLTITGRYTGKQYEDDLNQRPLADALTLDGVATVPLGKGFALQARAENIFDARVEAGISGANVVELAAPRTFWLGLRYRLR